ncbi:MAG: proton-conducting membrane transporter [Planctomycetaceae bacterium]|nr:proton-conducting membrane transporter [Planctomycetaceae bacterium]
MTQIDLSTVEQAVRRHGDGPDAVVPILQDIQHHYHFLPPEALEHVCRLTRITPASVLGVSTFYAQFRHTPAGRHHVRVCHGTACHVRNAPHVQQAIEHHLELGPEQDTDAARQFTVEKVACFGCCTLAPVVRIDDVTYGPITPDRVAETFREFQQTAADAESHAPRHATADGNGHVGEIRIALDSCCVAKGSDQVFAAFQDASAAFGAPLKVQRVGCVGMCHRTPMVEVRLPYAEPIVYSGVTTSEAPSIVARHFRPRRLHQRIGRAVNDWMDRVLYNEPKPARRHAVDVRDPTIIEFLGPQHQIATERFGEMDPLDLDAYLQHDGFAAWRRCVNNHTPEQVIDLIAQSGLRGRGGAGFDTARKWRAVAAAQGHPKYMICNGDEGDPGAFMDRMLLESFPYRVIEGMAIAAYAVGADEGIFYIRREYPLAVQRVREAIEIFEQRGLTGDDETDHRRPLRLSIREGAGAFVCGEETALIASIEGDRGTPSRRPPYPAESGLWNQPTLINNVETLSVLPWIVRHGPEAFASLGTEHSKGTKVFALAGKVKRGGLIEVPMGITIREVVEDMGGGTLDGRQFKAVQIGGPSGGCIPAALADTPIDYEALHDVGAIMGSGGLVVLDHDDCMVDLARYFLRFTQDQSCGKCSFCRVGTRRMLDILDRICQGHARADDLAQLEDLARSVGQSSLCGLGQTAPNAVLTTLQYFHDEYEAHLEGRCPAGRCAVLIDYRITDDCVGCTICAQHCPVDAIPMVPYRIHTIDDVTCTRCDTCKQVCPHEAIEVI